jgi:zinc resistance-associated protein
MKPSVKRAMTAAVLTIGVMGVTLQSMAQQGRPDDQRSGHDAQHRPPMSAEDRDAFLDARLAALRAGLRLTAEQDKVWPAVEAAARERAKIMMTLRQKERAAGPPADPVDGLRRQGEADMTRGRAALKLADAVQPLWSTLTDEQKRRLPMLARGILSEGMRGHLGPRVEPGPPSGRHDHGMGHDAPRPPDDRPPPPRPVR